MNNSLERHISNCYFFYKLFLTDNYETYHLAGSASLLVDGGVRTNLESGFISYIYQIGLLFTLIFLSCFAWLIAYSYKFHFSSKFVISLIFFLGYFFLGHAMFGVYGFIVFIATFILNKDDSRFG